MTEHKWKEGERVLIVRGRGLTGVHSYRISRILKVHKTGRFVVDGIDGQIRTCGRLAGRREGYSPDTTRVEPYSLDRHMELARPAILGHIRWQAATVGDNPLPRVDTPADLLDELNRRCERFEQLRDAVRAAQEATTPEALAEVYEGLAE